MPVTEIVLAMELTSAEAPNTCSRLGAASALLTIRGFRRRIASGDDLRFRWYLGLRRSPLLRHDHALGDLVGSTRAETSATVSSPILSGAVGHRGQLAEYPVVRLSP